MRWNKKKTKLFFGAWVSSSGSSLARSFATIISIEVTGARFPVSVIHDPDTWRVLPGAHDTRVSHASVSRMSRSRPDIGATRVSTSTMISGRFVCNLAPVTDSLINGLLRGHLYPSSTRCEEDSTLEEVVFYRGLVSLDYRSRHVRILDERESADWKSVDVDS